LDVEEAAAVRFEAATGLAPLNARQSNGETSIVPRRVLTVSGTKPARSRHEAPLTALAAMDSLPAGIDTVCVFGSAGKGQSDINNFRRREWGR